jgi:hypothetical protein
VRGAMTGGPATSQGFPVGKAGPEELPAGNEREVRAGFAAQGLMRTIGAALEIFGPGRYTDAPIVNKRRFALCGRGRSR